MKKILTLSLTLLVASTPLGVLGQLDFGSITERAKEVATEYDLPPEIVDQAKDLAKQFGLSKANLSNYANDALKALNGGENLEALNIFSKISDASLTPGQQSAYQDLKMLVDTYVLKKELEGDTAASGPLGSALAAIVNGDYGTVATQLRTLMSSIKPTGEQAAILTTLKEQYQTWADSSEDSDASE